MEKLFGGNNKALGFFDIIDLFGGGALKRLSVVALGIMPYITSSIVFQILTIAFPYFKELQQEGEYGRRKMGQWTRWAAIALTLIQGSVAAKAFQANGVIDPGFGPLARTVVCVTAGTMFLLWLGEQITEKGVGNGISFIIFAGIVARMPQPGAVVDDLADVSIFKIVLAHCVVCWRRSSPHHLGTTQGERHRFPVKYAPRQAGRRMVQAQRSHLPLKMAAAGVIPIIFAVSIVFFPSQMAGMYIAKDAHQSLIARIPMAFKNVRLTAIQRSVRFLDQGWVASLLYALLVMGFTYFYTAVIFDVRDLADNLKKYGGQIQGYAPGRPTQLFIDRVLTRITLRWRSFPGGGRAAYSGGRRRSCACRPTRSAWSAAPVS